METIPSPEGNAEKPENRREEGLPRALVDSLAQDPHFIEVLVDSILRDEKIFQLFADRLVETDSFKDAVSMEVRDNRDIGY